MTTRPIKRILILTHREADYGGSYIALGAAQVLGGENVFLYPDKVSYRGVTDNYASPWYGADSHGTTTAFPYMAEGIPGLAETPSYRKLEHLISMRFFDAVILESWRAEVQKAWSELGEDIRAANIPIILHDGEDYHALNQDALIAVRPHLYLKREFRSDKAMPSVVGNDNGDECRIVPFPFSVPESVLDFAEKVRQENPSPKYTVALMVGRSHEAREEIYNALLSGLPPEILEHAYLGISDPPAQSLHETGVHPLLPFWDYVTVLARSICAVVPRGHGLDTCRLWESYASSGVIMENIPLRIPDDPRRVLEGEKLPFGRVSAYNTSEEAVRSVVAACYAAEPWQMVRQAGIEHARTHHSCGARFRYLLSELAQLEGFGDE